MQPGFWDGEAGKFYDTTASIILEVYQAGGLLAVAQLPAYAQSLVSWEVFNQSAVGYLGQFRLETVRGITETTRKFAVSAIQDWIKSGARLDVLLNTLAPMFGKTRADMIGITEVTRAFAAGNKAAWRATNGLVSGSCWNTARDDKVCPYCSRLDGKIVDLSANFTIPLSSLPPEIAKNLTGDVTVQHPPAHVRCRCYLTPILSIDAFREGLRGIFNK